MDKLELLKNIVLGNSIAEYDKNLSNYFINTNYVDEFIEDRYDVVKGVKGAGKTSMLVALCSNQQKYKQLENVKLVQAINLKGDPDFKRAFAEVLKPINMHDLIDAWKIYIINLVWKNITDISDDYQVIEKYLKKHKLITNEPSFLGKIMYAFSRTKIKISNTIKSDGTMIQAVEFQNGDTIDAETHDKIIDFNFIFTELDKILLANDIKVWIIMDRLDDAFPDKTEESALAIKSLFYTYKDISVYDNLRIKIFIRDDIFKNITKDGFTSLTHVSSNTMATIEWSRKKLSQLLIERLLFNTEFKNYLSDLSIAYTIIDDNIRDKILKVLFKGQVDVGKKNPDSFGWIINHITDGLNIFTPRDLINLVDTARQYQIDEWKLSSSTSSIDYLIGPYALRKAYEKVSIEKMETQLFAEFADLRKHIEKFKNSKAEHNEETLKNLLGNRWRSIIKKLVDIGFIEEKQNYWKIPFVYRPALKIIQGSAFEKRS